MLTPLPLLLAMADTSTLRAESGVSGDFNSGDRLQHTDSGWDLARKAQAMRSFSSTSSLGRAVSVKDEGDWHRVSVSPVPDPVVTPALELRYSTAAALLECSQLRQRFVYAPGKDALALPADVQVVKVGGVRQLQWGGGGGGAESFAPPSAEEFCDAVGKVWAINGAAGNAYGFRRLEMLEANFQFHRLLNEVREEEACRMFPTDFFRVKKVDNHIHASSAMTVHQMMRFMRKKYEEEPHLAVFKDGRTLKEVMDEALGDEGVKRMARLNVDLLSMQANRSMFHRFDKFNASYNPLGKSDMRAIFMKTSNHINGRFFAESLKQIPPALSSAKDEFGHDVYLEPRVSIYGRAGDWEGLSHWFTSNKMASNRWKFMVQIPRIFSVHRKLGWSATFGEMLDNIFKPLFEATLDPAAHPELAEFLSEVGGFDCVDDESRVLGDDLVWFGKADEPDSYTDELVPYSYVMYYLYANLMTLNKLREARGMNTFPLQPHAGEAGHVHHLATCYLLAQSINHGIRVDKSPALQYLYYIDQIGMSICLSSNNALFTKLASNPFNRFFRCGLNVALGTDDPAQFSVTSQPLVEEYVIAKQHFDLSYIDCCEVARSSVLISNFPRATKGRWLIAKRLPEDKHTELERDDYDLPFHRGNDPHQTNIPLIRSEFRGAELAREINILKSDCLKVSETDGTYFEQREQLAAREMFPATGDSNPSSGGIASFRGGAGVVVPAGAGGAVENSAARSSSFINRAFSNAEPKPPASPVLGAARQPSAPPVVARGIEYDAPTPKPAAEWATGTVFVAGLAAGAVLVAAVLSRRP